MSKKSIEVSEGQEVPKELKEAIEGGEFVEIPKEKVVGFITIAFVKQNPDSTTPPQLKYEAQNIPALALPTLLRKVAKNIEDKLMKS
jgi:hypothetical protein